MTDKERQLLLKDLCARLPYGVTVCVRFNTGNPYTATVTAISADRDYIQVRENELHSRTGLSVEDIKPYLRPMSSMTEEEDNFVYNGHIEFWIREDYCNQRHLDYRGLIPMGLALEAPEGMYKTE